MSTTPFAKLSRQYRKDRGLLLGDVASRAGFTASYLSQIEAANKAIPDGFVARLALALGLTEREGSALERAAALSAKEFRIAMPSDARAKDRDMAHRLSVGFARMSVAKKQRILEILREDADA
jgi:transcriptional regulator with XRE-family HTH domain